MSGSRSGHLVSDGIPPLLPKAIADAVVGSWEKRRPSSDKRHGIRLATAVARPSASTAQAVSPPLDRSTSSSTTRMWLDRPKPCGGGGRRKHRAKPLVVRNFLRERLQLTRVDRAPMAVQSVSTRSDPFGLGHLIHAPVYRKTVCSSSLSFLWVCCHLKKLCRAIQYPVRFTAPSWRRGRRHGHPRSTAPQAMQCHRRHPGFLGNLLGRRLRGRRQAQTISELTQQFVGCGRQRAVSFSKAPRPQRSWRTRSQELRERCAEPRSLKRNAACESL